MRTHSLTVPRSDAGDGSSILPTLADALRHLGLHDGAAQVRVPAAAGTLKSKEAAPSLLEDGFGHSATAIVGILVLLAVLAVPLL
jgi:hypothetical protein